MSGTLNLPSHDSKRGRGGWREVNTMADLDTIPAEFKRIGMAVFVIEDETIWLLKSAGWVQLVEADTELTDRVVLLEQDLASRLTNEEIEKLIADALENGGVTPPDPGETFYIITEAGDRWITEEGDPIILE
jgi:hypothetical protein